MFQEVTFKLWQVLIMWTFASVGLYFLALTMNWANLAHFSL